MEDQRENNRPRRNRFFGPRDGSAMAIGISVGVALGLAMNNLALGIAIGIAIFGAGDIANRRRNR